MDSGLSETSSATGLAIRRALTPRKEMLGTVEIKRVVLPSDEFGNETGLFKGVPSR